ncbi:hypothetical protein, partial [Streptomyces sp. McG3]|uniref:hypothetical protein n=1 Tax=Streptomyces sp. McG3 TaxID=2725483 RepID=UPI001BE8BCDE
MQLERHASPSLAARTFVSSRKSRAGRAPAPGSSHADRIAYIVQDARPALVVATGETATSPA